MSIVAKEVVFRVRLDLDGAKRQLEGVGAKPGEGEGAGETPVARAKREREQGRIAAPVTAAAMLGKAAMFGAKVAAAEQGIETIGPAYTSLITGIVENYLESIFGQSVGGWMRFTIRDMQQGYNKLSNELGEIRRKLTEKAKLTSMREQFKYASAHAIFGKDAPSLWDLARIGDAQRDVIIQQEVFSAAMNKARNARVARKIGNWLGDHLHDWMLNSTHQW